MSHPDPLHDPENVKEYDEPDEYEEWMQHQQTYDEEAE